MCRVAAPNPLPVRAEERDGERELGAYASGAPINVVNPYALSRARKIG